MLSELARKVMKRICIMLSLAVAASALAVTLDDIKGMIRSGDLAEAAAALDSIGGKQPRNADVDLLKGEMFVASGDDSPAIAAYQSAVKKGSNDARLGLAEIAVREYRVDDADEFLEDYRAYIAKNRRKKLADESGDLTDRILRTRTMLDRVESIAVIDSMIVDTEVFLDAFKLSDESGSLNYPDILPDGVSHADPTVVYRTEDGREMIWADEDSLNNLVLVQSDALVGDTWSDPQRVGDHLSLGADANFPFLMPDGVTLYFASNGEGSLGGYDIYISRHNGSQFLDPQNLGMPYNSPYDDYMLAIDETTGVGWWATDRNHIPGCLTIYIFVPSDMRNNVASDDPNLLGRARLSRIADTWEVGADYSALKARIAKIAPHKSTKGAQFEFSMPDGRVITRYDQLGNERARQTMERYVSAVEQTDRDRSRLEELRQQYGAGDKSVAAEIINLEKRLKDSPLTLRRLSNEVVKAELNR